MSELNIDISKAKPFLGLNSYPTILKEAILQCECLLSETGKGNDFLGWLHLPSRIKHVPIKKIEDEAKRLKRISSTIVVIGIGGSYIGARAVIEALSDPFTHLYDKPARPLILYAGFNMSEEYHQALLNYLDTVDYSVIVISKSGTTIEPAVAFRIIKAHLKKKYPGQPLSNRIVVITDSAKGVLKKMAKKEKYPFYVIPKDVGGRYSVLTPVGLLPIAAAGFDIRKLLQGARDMEIQLTSGNDPSSHPSVIYAAIRNTLYRNGKVIEILASYEPALHSLTEWWKQLYGESEGKDNKGIFPAGVNLTADLHSMGQYIQEGIRNIFETVITIEKSENMFVIPSDKDNSDKLNFLAGQRLSNINHMAELGTALAHMDGGVPNILITIQQIDEYCIGQLIYFFEAACAISGYILGVNPFDQPGVEEYKNNMYALLNKRGYKKKGSKLRKRLL